MVSDNACRLTTTGSPPAVSSRGLSCSRHWRKMELERPETQLVWLASTAQAVGAIHGAGDVQVTNSIINTVGRSDSHNHTHVHYHGTVKDLKDFLDAISNFRKIQQDTLAKATPGTIVWLFDYKEFRLFIDVDGVLKILWGSGIPGAGKTILASIVIDKLEALARQWGNHICVVYFYIRYSDQNQLTIRGILEVFVKQTVERHPDCFELARQVYDHHLHEGTQPTEVELLQLLGQFAQKRKAMFCVLDALDEAPERIRLTLLRKLSSLGLRLFITSRPLPAIEAKFPAAHAFPILAQDQDLDLHIAEKIEASEGLQDLLELGGAEFEEHLIVTVKAKCGGMFLHASLQLDALQHCFTVHDAMQTLDAFPRRIEDVYEQTWQRIIQSDLHHASLAKTAFVWVLNAKQSMSIDQLRHALATSPDTHSFEPSRLMPEATLVSACRGLLTVDKESRLVRLVHYTAKEPLEGFLRTSFPHPHGLLAAVCIARLTDCGFQDKEFLREKELEDALKADPLLDYAYHAWVFHAQASLGQDFIASRLSAFITGCRAFPVTLSNDFLGYGKESLGPLHLVSFYNIQIAYAGPLNAHSVNEPTMRWSIMPLHLAILGGHHNIVKSLLGLPDILVNVRVFFGRTPLMFACKEGYEGIVKPLLAHPDIDVNLVDDSNYTALTYASLYGKEIIVKLLLSRPGIEVNAATPHSSTPLRLACEYGHISIIKLLLAVPEIDVNAVDLYNETAIKMAAQNGRGEIVRILLDAPGIDISVKSNFDGRTAMSGAAAWGHYDILRLLQEFESRSATLPSIL
ncbi:hypothetical protein BKA70DRAFT_1148668 [Coprinopsis sp. MPI-PUGE-AT-0042]|nr:hypothetical protein BKA70DRAFT_1148668 [Coprinopsis sp. MPI-PUGE-AT-0042]